MSGLSPVSFRRSSSASGPSSPSLSPAPSSSGYFCIKFPLISSVWHDLSFSFGSSCFFLFPFLLSFFFLFLFPFLFFPLSLPIYLHTFSVSIEIASGWLKCKETWKVCFRLRQSSVFSAQGKLDLISMINLVSDMCLRWSFDNVNWCWSAQVSFTLLYVALHCFKCDSDRFCIPWKLHLHHHCLSVWPCLALLRHMLRQDLMFWHVLIHQSGFVVSCCVLSFVQTDMLCHVSFTCRLCGVHIRLGALQHRLRRLQKSFHLKPRPLCQDLTATRARHTKTATYGD